MFHAKFSLRRSESLVETIAAVTVIVISTVAAMSLLRTAITSNEIIGEKVVAMNLAMEAIEGVRSIRDTNALKYESTPECWNKFNVTTSSDCLDGTAPEIEEGRIYYLERNFTGIDGPIFSWDLAEEFDLDGVNSFISLYEMELEVDVDDPLETMQIYAQTGIGAMTTVKEDAYKRQMIVVYPGGPGSDYYDVTVTVEWIVNDTAKSLSLTRSIANLSE